MRNYHTQGKGPQGASNVPHAGRSSKSRRHCESTLREYLKDPEFVKRYEDAFANLVQDAADQAKQGFASAIERLRGIVEDNNQAPQVQIQASRSLLEYGMKLTEQADILAKLDELDRWKNNEC